MARISLLLVSLLMFGCAQKAEQGVAAMAPAPTPQPGRTAASAANRFLAYEHTVTIDAEDDKVAPLFEAAQTTCRESVAESCAILEARISSGDASYATLRFRAKAEGIRKLVKVLSSQGKVSGMATSAEDLAGPIQDTAKQLAMLTDYRSRLEALRSRSNNDVDALIKLNRELADTQSQIEALTGQQAQLVQRVETEILNVTISSNESRSFWSPIGDSASDFGDDLSQGIASAITALAYIIPWSLVLILVVWVARKLWGLRKRKQAGA